MDDEPAFVSVETYLPCVGYYDPGVYLYDLEIWPEPDIGSGFCFQNALGEIDILPDDTTVLCGEPVDYYAEGTWSNAQVFPVDSHPEITWSSNFGDEGYHNVLVEIRERTATDIEASDLMAVLVERKTDDEILCIRMDDK